MWLYFRVQYPGGKRRVFTLYGNRIEKLLEGLNYFVSSGCRLVSAYLIDGEGQRTDLPLAAFDGAPMENWVRRLEVEYKLIVTSPIVQTNVFQTFVEGNKKK